MGKFAESNLCNICGHLYHNSRGCYDIDHKEVDREDCICHGKRCENEEQIIRLNKVVAALPSYATFETLAVVDAVKEVHRMLNDLCERIDNLENRHECY